MSRIDSVPRPIHRLYRRAVALIQRMRPHRSVPQLHAFWRAPDSGNQPADYLAEGHERSDHLAELLLQYGTTADTVLEIGCNAGRNLERLRRAGFTSLTGIEINPDALRLLRARLPELAATARLHEGPAEELLPTLDPHDIVFTMAVLEHIHDTSADRVVFPHIRRITGRLLVTIEDERDRGWRHFPRDYSRVFADFEQVAAWHDPPGCPPGFVARVFRRRG